jgi:hypothetical protein
MGEPERKRVRLRGGPEDTASSVSIEPDGSIVVEFYDFSTQAQQSFGNDVAYVLTIGPSRKKALLAALLDGKDSHSGDMDRDGQILRVMEERFESYFRVKTWLEKRRIPFRTRFDPWA